MEAILREGEEFLEDIELAEGNVQQAYNEYRDQVRLGGWHDVCVCVLGPAAVNHHLPFTR